MTGVQPLAGVASDRVQRASGRLSRPAAAGAGAARWRSPRPTTGSSPPPRTSASAAIRRPGRAPPPPAASTATAITGSPASRRAAVTAPWSVRPRSAISRALPSATLRPSMLPVTPMPAPCRRSDSRRGRPGRSRDAWDRYSGCPWAPSPARVRHPCTARDRPRTLPGSRPSRNRRAGPRGGSCGRRSSGRPPCRRPDRGRPESPARPRRLAAVAGAGRAGAGVHGHAADRVARDGGGCGGVHRRLAASDCRGYGAPRLRPSMPTRGRRTRRRRLDPSLCRGSALDGTRRGVAQPGSAAVLGTAGRRFESYRPDQHPGHLTLPRLILLTSRPARRTRTRTAPPG